MEKVLGVGIIGAGLIGEKRAKALKEVKGSKLIAVSDLDLDKAQSFAKEYGCLNLNIEQLLSNKNIQIVIIAVPNKFTASLAIKALQNGKYILCEKPFGINSRESLNIISAARRNKCLVKVGFNHRYHAGIWRAKEIFDKGGIGKILFIRARYGYGGRLGMEKEWRMNKAISGGGELLDQGVHIIDLARWFAGDFKEVYGLIETKFWKTDVDDNAFVILKNKNVTVSFHVSSTNWKNIFSFEIFGDMGFLTVHGKGGSYGVETLTFGKRKKEFGVPEIKVFKFKKDTSWIEEWKNFLGAINKKNNLIGDSEDGFRANRLVEAIYESSKSGSSVKIDRDVISKISS